VLSEVRLQVHIEPHAHKLELVHRRFDECVTEASTAFKEKVYVVIRLFVPGSLFFQSALGLDQEDFSVVRTRPTAFQSRQGAWRTTLPCKGAEKQA